MGLKEDLEHLEFMNDLDEANLIDRQSDPDYEDEDFDSDVNEEDKQHIAATGRILSAIRKMKPIVYIRPLVVMNGIPSDYVVCEKDELGAIAVYTNPFEE